MSWMTQRGAWLLVEVEVSSQFFERELCGGFSLIVGIELVDLL